MQAWQVGEYVAKTRENQEAAQILAEPTCRRGWLSKRSSGLFPTWRKRWCVLERGTFSLCQPESELAKKKFAIDPTTTVQIEQIRGKADATFSLQIGPKRYLMMADSPQIMESWIRAFAACGSPVESSQQSPSTFAPDILAAIERDRELSRPAMRTQSASEDAPSSQENNGGESETRDGFSASGGGGGGGGLGPDRLQSRLQFPQDDSSVTRTRTTEKDGGGGGEQGQNPIPPSGVILADDPGVDGLPPPPLSPPRGGGGEFPALSPIAPLYEAPVSDQLPWQSSPQMPRYNNNNNGNLDDIPIINPTPLPPPAATAAGGDANPAAPAPPPPLTHQPSWQAEVGAMLSEMEAKHNNKNADDSNKNGEESTADAIRRGFSSAMSGLMPRVLQSPKTNDNSGNTTPTNSSNNNNNNFANINSNNSSHNSNNTNNSSNIPERRMGSSMGYPHQPRYDDDEEEERVGGVKGLQQQLRLDRCCGPWN